MNMTNVVETKEADVSPKQQKITSPLPNVQPGALWGVLLTVVLNSTGQVLFKAARLAQPDASLFELFLHLETWAGFIIYGLASVCWLWVLSKADLSFAYPILSLTFPIVVALSAFLFAETISPMRWAGVGVIIFGVSLLART